MKLGEKRRIDTNCPNCGDHRIVTTLKGDPPFTSNEVEEIKKELCSTCESNKYLLKVFNKENLE